MGKATKINKPAEKGNKSEVERKAEDIGVPAEQILRGGYSVVDVRLDDAERVTTHRTLLNRGGCAIDRWMAEEPSKLFHEQEKAAIRYCQALWSRIDRKGPPDMSGIRRNLWLGQSEHEALAEISAIRGYIPNLTWNCFENICRFETDATAAGEYLAGNRRSANDMAKMCVASVAAQIAKILNL